MPERIAAIVKGIAEACVAAGCALIGGETAEHPGLLGPDEYDVAGSTTGVVEASRPARPGPGAARRRGRRDGVQRAALQRLLAGPPRPARAAPAGDLDRHVDELGRTLGEELLEPTRIYAKACLALAGRTETHAMSHVTGGGLAANLARVMPAELAATIDRGTWTPPPIFGLVREVGRSQSPTWSGPSTAASAWSR